MKVMCKFMTHETLRNFSKVLTTKLVMLRKLTARLQHFCISLGCVLTILCHIRCVLIL